MRSTTLLMAGCLLGLAVSTAAEPTPVSVHVLSRDAKFIGSGVGGVLVTLRDAASGRTLAEGVVEGGTGDTEVIMGERKHGAALVTPDTAGFAATLDLSAPTRIEVTAYGPLDHPESANTVTAIQWVIPGTSAGEQGWILELPGLIVDVHDTPELVRVENGEARVPVAAMVRMMCGCPLTPGGLWNSDEFQISARVLRDGVEFASVPLEYAGEASEFTGELVLTQSGRFDLRVQAHQPRTGNTGVMERVLLVE